MAEAERNDWLRYAWKWVADNDSVGYLQMPGSRVMSPGSAGKPTWFWPNPVSEACPNGFNTEGVIRELWGTTAVAVRPSYKQGKVPKVKMVGTRFLVSVDGRRRGGVKSTGLRAFPPAP